jgi:hypothetical protein
MGFFFTIFLRDEKKDSKITQTYFLMLDASKVNSLETTKYYSIKFFALGHIY